MWDRDDPARRPQTLEERTFYAQEQRDRQAEKGPAAASRPVCVFVWAGGCVGTLDRHHVISQNRLKRLFPYGAIDVAGPDEVHRLRPAGRGDRPDVTLRRIVDDGRNIVAACRRHHDLITGKRIYVEFPASVWEFAKEYGLVGMLENDLAREGRS